MAQGDQIMVETRHSHPTIGTPEYDEHLKGEIEHYRDKYDTSSLVLTVPQSWVEVESRTRDLMSAASGDHTIGHLVTKLKQRPGVRMLSIGSGPGGTEICLAQHERGAEIVCLDVNPEVLELGRQRAKELNLNISFQTEDLNKVELPALEFDLVFCHAALHHLIELESLASQIKRTLRPNGELVVVDVITRNGYLMWPETRKVVSEIFKTLPAQFRVNHTAYAHPQLDDEVWESDTSASSMECIRSQDILSILQQEFETSVYVPSQSICRRFFDGMYGPNYDLSRPLDKAIFNWIWELDNHYLQTKQLRPETFFGIYRKRPGA
jgi:ubiquinone/menaquinone biosynthesis C-methylase UbiE